MVNQVDYPLRKHWRTSKRKEIYTSDACHYTFEAEVGCDQCPDCGKEQVRPAGEQESKEYPERRKHTDTINGSRKTVAVRMDEKAGYPQRLFRISICC